MIIVLALTIWPIWIAAVSHTVKEVERQDRIEMSQNNTKTE